MFSDASLACSFFLFLLLTHVYLLCHDGRHVAGSLMLLLVCALCELVAMGRDNGRVCMYVSTYVLRPNQTTHAIYYVLTL